MTHNFDSEKNAEIYTLLWDSFNLSQGDLGLQERMMKWASKNKLLPKIPPEIPPYILENFGPPTQHQEKGKKQSPDWEKAYSLIQKIFNDPDLINYNLFVRFFTGEKLGSDKYELMDTWLRRMRSQVRALPENDRRIVEELVSELLRRGNLIATWERLQKINKDDSPYNEENELGNMLEIFLAHDKRFITSEEGRPRTGVSQKPDDEKDPFASYARRYLAKQTPIHSPAMSELFRALRNFLRKNESNFSQTLDQIIRAWEERHPGHTF